MKFIGRLFLCTLMALALMRNCTAGPAPVTARLTIAGATCSGTVVAYNVILSAQHCFVDEEEDDLYKILGLPTPPKPPLPSTMKVDGYTVEIVGLVFDDNDHALVKVGFTFKDFAKLGSRPAVGAHVHYWGNPAGVNNVYREGCVTGYHHGDMVIDVNGFFGDSGAGIFDEDGKVVGVMSSIEFHRHQGLTFRLMGASELEFTPLQYSMMGVAVP
jgi:trypsin-like peptidase